MNQNGEWRSYEATAMWWSFAVTMLLLVDLIPVRVVGLACLGTALARRWRHVRRKPVLLALLSFSLAVTGVFEYAGKDFVATTIAFTGWVAQGPYMSAIMFVVLALLSERVVVRYLVAAMFVIPVAFGVVEWIVSWPRASVNPYLAIGVWRPAWTVAIPLFWIAALLIESRLNRLEREPLGPEAA